MNIDVYVNSSFPKRFKRLSKSRGWNGDAKFGDQCFGKELFINMNTHDLFICKKLFSKT